MTYLPINDDEARLKCRLLMGTLNVFLEWYITRSGMITKDTTPTALRLLTCLALQEFVDNWSDGILWDVTLEKHSVLLKED